MILLIFHPIIADGTPILSLSIEDRLQKKKALNLQLYYECRIITPQ